MKNFQVRILTNSRRTTTIIRAKINGKEGNSVIFIPPSTTGTFTDTTDMDSIAEHELGSIGYEETKFLDDHGALMLENVSAEFATPISKFNELEGVKKELENERKETKRLRKTIELMSEDKREDTHYIEQLKRMIDYLCGNRGFTSNVTEK